MKTENEYLKENRILYFHIAEENDFPDDAGEGWANWSDIIDQQRVNWILREMLTGALVANGKCTEYDSKDYINNLVTQKQKETQAMKIKIDQKCLVKVGKNEVEVTVKAQTAKGWLVETGKGRTFPVNDPTRFILPEAEVASVESAEPVKSASSKQGLSMLEAAIETLKRSGKPMNVKEIIAAMIEANLWKPGPGKTPHLSLSSTIQRNLKKPNCQLPIKKSEERGKFEYIGDAK
jgi:hypothetical protein